MKIATDSAIENWVYLFSKFTGEALLFEALTISFLLTSYSAFWILKKRRHGVIGSAVPSGVVKTYLNELIFDAEQLRAQLFGLLASAGVRAPVAAPARFSDEPSLTAATINTNAPLATIPPPADQADPELQAKLSQLESRMAEQARAMEAIVAQKKALEQELAAAKKATNAGAETKGAAEPAEVPKLKEKIQLLESRLAEYSVIEDDLANLKRLQQENAQLKASLGQGGAAAKAAPVPTQAPAPAAPSDASFESLVDKVEESLTESKKSSTPASTAAPGPNTMGKSDDDLVAEFEKMLNG